MSERNGDRARFNRERRRKIFQRKRTRDLKNAHVVAEPLPHSLKLATRL